MRFLVYNDGMDKPRDDSSTPPRPEDKVKSFPALPGVYLMKDEAGRVIYVGKAKRLRHRASSYFKKQALEDARTAEMVRHIADIDCIVTPSEVEALLMEARLIKDIQPRFNVELKDDKSFPYLQIRVREEYPRVEFTRAPKRGTKLFGPFTSARSLRAAIQVLQRIFKFRTCSLDIQSDDPRWRWFRPCLLHSIHQCTAPCNFSVDRETYRQQIRQLILVLEGKKDQLIAEMASAMKAASQNLQFEKAAQIRDDMEALNKLNLRGEADKHVQPEVFVIDPKRGVAGLKKVLKLSALPRIIEGVDVAHLGGAEVVASLVQFIDGMPFKPGYRRFRIRTTDGNDDFAAMREVVTRRFRRLQKEQGTLPDLLMIDGGKGQLHAAQAALQNLGSTSTTVIALAKKNEEIYTLDHEQPMQLSRSSYALRLLQYIRDEAHRFAQHYHHILRQKRLDEMS